MSRRRKSTILLVDNNNNYRTTLREALEESGYEVVESFNSDDAISKIGQRKNQVNLVLVDVRLNNDDDPQDHSGLKFLRQVPVELPAIVLTAYKDAEVVRAAYQPAPGQIEPKAYLFKGDGFAAILATIDKVLVKIHPSTRPWYQEKSVWILGALALIMLIGGGIYVGTLSKDNQLISIIIVGVVIEILAALILRVFRIGE